MKRNAADGLFTKPSRFPEPAKKAVQFSPWLPDPNLSVLSFGSD